MPSKKRKTRDRPTIHPKNKYSENPPDFALLASLYPSFEPFVFYSRNGRPLIDWTDYNSTRELTRVLLLHDHGLDWWIPDGQLCPTVPNRSNYIHWIEDLLSLDIIPNVNESGGRVKGFDIGTGANCIYPLLGASLCAWSFVGSDVTDIALEWAERNVKNNSNIKDLIEIRKVESECLNVSENAGEKVWPLASSSSNLLIEVNQQYSGPPILLGVVRDGEKFDFCMCNPPFFESMNEAGSNPKTSCGGTQEEMVYPGGEKAFITRIIEDSVVLKQTIRWYTSMIGRKSNLKFLILKLREVGVTIVKTTEFVQGQTCRWGLAWSFVPPVKRIISTASAEKSALSFMLEGLQSQVSALSVLQSIESFFSTHDASCKLSTSSFTVDVNLSDEQSKSILKNGVPHYDEAASNKQGGESMDNSNSLDLPQTNPWLRFSVFQQIPGTLLVKGSLQQKETSDSGHFFSIFQQLEEVLKVKFCRAKIEHNPFGIVADYTILTVIVPLFIPNPQHHSRGLTCSIRSSVRGVTVFAQQRNRRFLSNIVNAKSMSIQSSLKSAAAHNRLLAFDCGDFLGFQTKTFLLGRNFAMILSKYMGGSNTLQDKFMHI